MLLASNNSFNYESHIRHTVSQNDKAGKDGVSGRYILDNITTFADSTEKIFSNKLNHKFTPYLELLQSKGRGKAPRIISKPSLKDKIILGVMNKNLSETLHLETPFQLPNEQIRRVIQAYKTALKNPKYIILKYDIRGFYDNIPQYKLLHKLSQSALAPHTYELIKSAIRTPTTSWKESRKSLTKQSIIGIPQGLPISNILASFYLNELDRTAKQIFPHYIRYVDDILIFTESESQINKIQEVTNALGLEFNEKSQKTSIHSSFEFLGYHFNSGLLSPRHESQERFLTQILKLIKSPKETFQRHSISGRPLSDEELIKTIIFKINFKISGAISENRRYGWAAYFAQTTNLSCLFKIQKIIENKIKSKLGEDTLKRHPLRKIITCYYDMRHHGGERYALNYDKIQTTKEKVEFLVKNGILSADESATYSAEQVNRIFSDVVKKELKSLEVDVGYIK